MELLTRNPQPPCRCTDGQPERWEHVFTHNLTRMERRTLHRTLHDILSQPCTSMLLFKIDPQRLAIFPLERDAPLGPATAVTGSHLPRFHHRLPRQAGPPSPAVPGAGGVWRATAHIERGPCEQWHGPCIKTGDADPGASHRHEALLGFRGLMLHHGPRSAP